MTHSEIVNRAERWLRNDLHCRVVLAELRSDTYLREIPDVIGWVRGFSILIEVKTSRADFFADQIKSCRRRDLASLGDWRFYLTQDGLLNPNEIPEGWGLYEVRGRSVVFAAGVKYRNAAVPPFESCLKSEQAMLVSALARS